MFFVIALCAMFFFPSILGCVGGRFLTGGAGLGFAQSPNYLWAKSAGGNDYDYGYSVATDASGNCFVCGRFYSSSITFGSYTLNNAGDYDIFLVKYAPDGNVIWAKSAGGTSEDDGISVATDASGN